MDKKKRRKVNVSIEELKYFTDNALSLSEIKRYVQDKYGVVLHKYSISYYLKADGFLEKWRKNRKLNMAINVNDEIPAKKNFLSGLNNYLNKLAENDFALEKIIELSEKWPRRMSIEYLEKAYILFEAYDSARKNGTKLSYEEFSSISGFKHLSQIGRILKKVNLIPQKHNIKKRFRRSTVYEKEAVLNLSNSNMTNVDIAYFLGFTDYVVYNILGERNVSSLPRFRGRLVTYKVRSEVFYSTDVGFSINEIDDYFNLPLGMAEYVLDNRNYFERELVSLISKVWPDENIIKGYRLKTSPLVSKCI